MKASEATREEPFRLTMTEKAAEALRSVIAKEKKKDAMLRIFISGRGCCGFSYGMMLDDKTQEGDKLVELSDIKIVVDPESAAYLNGSEIDYAETLMGSGFIINNPNAAETCECGHSFKAR